jgi:hypothetical protein
VTGIEFYDPAPDDGEVVYDRGMFDGMIGKVVPVRVRPSGRKVGDARVLAVDVDADGLGVTCSMEVPDNCAALTLLRSGRPGFSFTMREPGEVGIQATEVFRDPLAARPPAVRRRR